MGQTGSLRCAGDYFAVLRSLRRSRSAMAGSSGPLLLRKAAPVDRRIIGSGTGIGQFTDDLESEILDEAPHALRIARNMAVTLVMPVEVIKVGPEQEEAARCRIGGD